MTVKNPANRHEVWPLDRLTPFARNARTHSPLQISQLAASMRTWGWTMPVLIDESGGIIAGHGRVLAAPLVGFTEASVVIAEGWTDAMKRAYVPGRQQAHRKRRLESRDPGRGAGRPAGVRLRCAAHRLLRSRDRRAAADRAVQRSGGCAAARGGRRLAAWSYLDARPAPPGLRGLARRGVVGAADGRRPGGRGVDRSALQLGLRGHRGQDQKRCDVRCRVPGVPGGRVRAAGRGHASWCRDLCRACRHRRLVLPARVRRGGTEARVLPHLAQGFAGARPLRLPVDP
ncbi:ParB N-terminal domain-containing protein (plasmid) [Cupriavidus necator]|nr:ParB N-terminal domain-containing protein [Cupriavidus necator]